MIFFSGILGRFKDQFVRLHALQRLSGVLFARFLEVLRIIVRNDVTRPQKTSNPIVRFWLPPSLHLLLMSRPTTQDLLGIDYVNEEYVPSTPPVYIHFTLLLPSGIFAPSVLL